MSNTELKTQLSTLLNENPEDFVETLNEVFAEEWLKECQIKKSLELIQKS